MGKFSVPAGARRSAVPQAVRLDRQRGQRPGGQVHERAGSRAGAPDARRRTREAISGPREECSTAAACPDARVGRRGRIPWPLPPDPPAWAPAMVARAVADLAPAQAFFRKNLARRRLPSHACGRPVRASARSANDKRNHLERRRRSSSTPSMKSPANAELELATPLALQPRPFPPVSSSMLMPMSAGEVVAPMNSQLPFQGTHCVFFGQVMKRQGWSTHLPNWHSEGGVHRSRRGGSGGQRGSASHRLLSALQTYPALQGAGQGSGMQRPISQRCPVGQRALHADTQRPGDRPSV